MFMLIITWLLNRMQRPPARIREPPPPVNKTKSALSASTTQTGLRPIEQHTKPPDKAKKAVNKLHKRRNSIDATPPRPKAPSIVSKQRSKDDIGLRLSGKCDNQLKLSSSCSSYSQNLNSTDCFIFKFEILSRFCLRYCIFNHNVLVSKACVKFNILYLLNMSLQHIINCRYFILHVAFGVFCICI